MEGHRTDSAQTASQLLKPFDRFPTELWIEVIQDMEPRDVLSLSGACRSLRSMLSQRGIWVTVLVSLCRREGLFEPSYSFDTMDLEALQRAALGPYRWRRMIKNHHASDVENTVNTNELEPITTAKVPDVWAYQVPFNGVQLHLVPGGRFLLIATGTSLQLWDIGPVGKALPVDAQMVSRQEWVSDSFVEDIQFASPATCIVEENKLRVAVATFDRNELSVRIFEISPMQKDAAFVLLACIQFTIDDRTVFSIRLWLHPTCVYINCSAAGILWDFKFGHYTLVPADALPRPFKSSFTGSFVAHLRERSMTLWSVPFKEQYLLPAPSGETIILRLPEGLEQPAPDFIADLPSQFGEGIRILDNDDPYSFVVEISRPYEANKPWDPFSESMHRVGIKMDPTDRHQLEVEGQHLVSFEGCDSIPHAGVDIPESSGQGVEVWPPDSFSILCLRTVSPDICKVPSSGDSGACANGEGENGARNIICAMTVICPSPHMAFSAAAFCPASGRAAFRMAAENQRMHDLYFHDYLRWSNASG